MITLNKPIRRRSVLKGGLATIFVGAPQGGSPPPPTLAWAALNISNTTWIPDGSVQNIADIVATLNDGSSSAGAQLFLSGTDGSSFQFTNGGVTPCKLQNKAGTGVGTYNGTLQISRSDVNGGALFPTTEFPIVLVGTPPPFPGVAGRLLTNKTSTAIPASPSTPFHWRMGHLLFNAALKTSAATTSGAVLPFLKVPNGISAGKYVSNLTNPSSIAADRYIQSTTDTTVTLDGPVTSAVGAGDLIAVCEVPAGKTVAATLDGNAVRCRTAFPYHQASGGLGWIEPMLDMTGQQIPAGVANYAQLLFAAIDGNVASGSYSSSTGAASLQTTSPHGIGVGQEIMVFSLAGTGGLYKLNGIWTTTAGTSGTTVNFTGPTGLGSITITGGQVDASTRTDADWIAIGKNFQLTNLTPRVENRVQSGAYSDSTGAVSLSTYKTHGLTPGDPVILYGLQGSGSFRSLAGRYICAAGTTGTTIKCTAATGLGAISLTDGFANYALPSPPADMGGPGTWSFALDGGPTNRIETRGVNDCGLMVMVSGPLINTAATPPIAISSISFVAAPSQWNGAYAGYAVVTTATPHGIPVSRFTCNTSNGSSSVQHLFVPNPTTDLIGKMILVENSLGKLVPQCQVSDVTTGPGGILYLSRPTLSQMLSGDTVVVGTSFQAMITGATQAGYNGWQMGAIAIDTNKFVYPLMVNPGGTASAGTFQPCHRGGYMKAEFLVAEKSDGSLGPIAFNGPAFCNDLLYNTSPCMYTFDLAIREGTTTVRTQNGIMAPPGAPQKALRLDGLWEWSANDPSPLGAGFWTDADYTQTRKTCKIPSFEDGITEKYTGLFGGEIAITNVNTSTGVFTTTNNSAFFKQSDQSLFFPGGCFAIKVSIGGTLPSPFQANTAYWCRSTDSTGTHFAAYPTKLDAFQLTNQIIPTTQGSGTITVYAALAAGAPGVFAMSNGQGATADDGYFHEVEAAGWHYGRKPALQQLARVNAHCYASMMTGHIDGWTGQAPSVLPQSLTPAAMGYGKIYTGTPSTAGPGPLDVNGGLVPAGGTAGNYLDTYHVKILPFGTWEMDGGGLLRDDIIAQAHFMLLWLANTAGGAPGRNYKISGTPFSGCSGLLKNGSLSKQGANDFLHLMLGLFVARTKIGPDADYFGNAFDQQFAFWQAYSAFQGGNYPNCGILQAEDLNALDSTGDFSVPGTYGSGARAMGDYIGTMVSNIAFATMLLADVKPNLLTLANFSHKYFGTQYLTSKFAYYSPEFYATIQPSNIGDPAPTAWLPDSTKVMPTYDQSNTCMIWFDGGRLNWISPKRYQANKAPFGWLTLANDGFRLFNYDTVYNTVLVTPKPAELTYGLPYYLRNVINNADGISGSAQLSTTADDTGIVSMSNKGGNYYANISSAGAMRVILPTLSGVIGVNDVLFNNNQNPQQSNGAMRFGLSMAGKITAGSGAAWTVTGVGGPWSSVWPNANMSVAAVSGDGKTITLNGSVGSSQLSQNMIIGDDTVAGHIPAGTKILSLNPGANTITVDTATTVVAGESIAFYAPVVSTCGGGFSPGAATIAAAPSTGFTTRSDTGASYCNLVGAAFAMEAVFGHPEGATCHGIFAAQLGPWPDNSVCRTRLGATV